MDDLRKKMKILTRANERLRREKVPESADEVVAEFQRPKAKEPDPYNGATQQGCKMFLLNMELYQSLVCKRGSDEEKIILAGTYLRNAALEWFSAQLLLNRHKFTRSWSSFSRALTANFGDPNPARTSLRMLEACIQTGSVTAYTTAFRQIEAHLGPDYGRRALLRAYDRGLKASIKDELAHQARYPRSLRGLIKAAQKVENRMADREIERRRDLARTNSSSARNPANNTSNTYQNHNRPVPQL